MLFQCADCGKRISQRAAACPHCGAPTGSTELIEKTAKRWKLLQLAGAILTIPGFAGLLTILLSGSQATMIPWVVLMSAGVAVAIIGRLVAWWFHG